MGLALSGLRFVTSIAGEVEPAELDVITVLVGGLDSREPGQPENADVFIIARVDVPNGTIRAVSVPRDLYLEIPGFGYDKITRTYDFGSKSQGGEFKAGAATMKATVERNFGITVDGVVVTTFGGFEQIIDALAGIDVLNPYDLYDGQFPTPDYGYKEIFFPEGWIHLNGEQALDYVRTRHQDSDEGRVMRQQLVLNALLEKAQQPDIVTKLPDLVHENRRAVRTDLGASKRLALALAVPNFSTERIAYTDLHALVYSDYTPQGMWIYSGDWSQIPGYVQGYLASP
jgi:polyisoprenyl-teichoic acid--peptidoglycan teichoic acid transferase